MIQPPNGTSEAHLEAEEAQETLRAIRAGEVDAFLVSGDGSDQRVFTLATADRPYRIFVENMRDGAATVSPSGIILYVNRRLVDLLSCPRETIVGSPLADFVGGHTPIAAEHLAGPNRLGATFELDLLDGEGAAVPVLVGASPLEVDGELLTCLTFTDLSARKAQDREIARLSRDQTERMTELQGAQAALTKQATHDALTGLPNRALVVDRIEQALFRAKRTGLCTAVLFVDLDRFKHVNDIHGHAAGDKLLRAVADQLVAALRPMDSVARIGGDEFVVLAPDVASHLDAVDIGNRLVDDLGRRLESSESGDRVVASIGIAVSVGGKGTAEELIKEADLAMYRAKSFGGGRAEVFDATLGRQVRQRLAAGRMVRSALDDHRITVLYQPILNLQEGGIAGFDALARIVADDGSLLLPADFIPAAVDSGLVVPLGMRVLEIACEQASSWQPSASGTTVAVNLSIRQLQTHDLATMVQERLDQCGLRPNRLHLELTEDAIIDLHPEVLDQLGKLRELGVEIGIDDFGTGYASLTHLRRLPLSFLKIERSLVGALGADVGDKRIVSAIIDLAANLGLRSIAHGVESQHQLDRLRELGCDQAQGRFFSSPLAPTEVPAALQQPDR